LFRSFADTSAPRSQVCIDSQSPAMIIANCGSDQMKIRPANTALRGSKASLNQTNGQNMLRRPQALFNLRLEKNTTSKHYINKGWAPITLLLRGNCPPEYLKHQSHERIFFRSMTSWSANLR